VSGRTRATASTALIVAGFGLLLGACSNDESTSLSAEVQASVFVDVEEQVESEYASLRAGQRAIRECMEAAGFDYVELDPGKDVFLQTGWYSGPQPEAYVAEFGYGLSIPVDEEALQGFADPNYDLLDSLAPNVRDAWEVTYQGTPESPGCASAGDVIPDAGGDFQERFQRTFEHQLDEMMTRIFADQRVLDADAAWLACMNDQGFDEGWRYPQDPPTEIGERAHALYANGLPPDGSAELLELQEFERAVASADLRCPNNNFGGWQSCSSDLYREYEQEFFDQHEAEILALVETSTPA